MTTSGWSKCLGSLAMLGSLLLVGCASDEAAAPTGERFPTPPGFPEPPIPANNLWSEAKFQLGRHLFYDTRLSANQQGACASCHEPGRAFADGKPKGVGSTGEETPRNSQALVNIAWNSTLTWGNPLLLLLEDQLLIPIFGEHPIELGVVDKDAVLQRFTTDPLYQELFAKAYPGKKPGWTEVVGALATFVRGLVSADSPYDRYLAGDLTALPPEALRGMDLFFSEELECHHCHGGFNFTEATTKKGQPFGAALFQNNGLYNIGGTGAYPTGNGGVFEVTGNPADMGRFRAPTLRNISVTGPYMHDGSIATLDAVLDHYARGGRLVESGPYAGDGAQNPNKSGLVPGFSLSVQQRSDLLTFLHTLTDEAFLANPRFANPFAQPRP